MDIDSLPAGRELDALVAEKVMGWRRIERKVANRGFATEWWQERHWQMPDGITGSTMAPVDLLPYSTDIAAAWEVVEKLPGRWMIDCVPGFGCAAYYEKPDDDLPKFRGDAPTAPLAICRAALKAVT